MKISADPNYWRSLVIIVIATIVAFPLRIWPLGQLGFNQFDEGIYGMAAGWIFNSQGIASIDPSLIPYAPPGYPILVGISFFFLGISDQAALLVSAIAGTLTIPVVAWISKRIFGHQAAVVSAWCVCLSGPHIAFSRMALTDAPFLLVWSIGFALSLRFLENPRFLTGLGMGLSVGLAQQFKYNGWLLGGVVIASTLVGIACSKEERRSKRWLRLGCWGGFAAGIAWIVVYPWYRFVENHGGYDALLKHQRSYLGGWSAWWPHLLSQVNQAVVLAGPAWISIITVLTVGLSSWLLRSNRSGSDRRWSLQVLKMVGLIGPLIAAPVTTSLLAIPGLLTKGKISDRFLGVSWFVLLMVSPFYHPYARLWLPIELLHWIALGGLAIQFIEKPIRVQLADLKTRGSIPAAWPLGLIAIGFVASGPGFPFASPGRFGHPGLFDPSDSLHSVADHVVKRIPPGVSGLRTLVRPALSFYLGGRIAYSPQSDLTTFETSRDLNQWGLIDSAILSSNLGRPDQPGRRRSLEPILGRWELVEEIPAMTSLPTVLDLDPSNPGRPRDESLAYFWLIRPRNARFTR